MNVVGQAPTTVITATGSYRVVADAVLRAEALAVVELTDPWTGGAPEQLRATSLTPLTTAHVTAGHLVVTGRASRAFPHLDTVSATLAVRLDRPARRPQLVEIEIPAASPLPWRTAVDLDANPLTITGRVREADFPHAPIPAAEVAVTGLPGLGLVAVRTPLGHAHTAGTAVQIRALTDNGGTTVADVAAAGSDRLHLTSAAGIGPATVLVLGATERVEHARVLTTLPGDVVVLRSPLVRSRGATEPVRRCTLGATGASTILARATQPGDGVVLTAAALIGDVLEIVDGGSTELRSLDLVADTGGGWRLDGVRGVPQIALTVSAPGFQTSGPVVHPLDGRAAVLDVELAT